MQPNTAVSATTVPLEHESVAADQSVSGSPTTAATALDVISGLEVGIWEMSPGVMRDVEAEEVFVVLSGTALVEFADGTASLSLSAGDVVRLAEGTQTTWTVTETLRKVYLTQA